MTGAATDQPLPAAWRVEVDFLGHDIQFGHRTHSVFPSATKPEGGTLQKMVRTLIRDAARCVHYRPNRGSSLPPPQLPWATTAKPARLARQELAKVLTSLSFLAQTG
jgi:hypothetical protein